MAEETGNVLVSRYLRPKSIADTLSITLFTSIGDKDIDIGDKVSAILDTSILTSLMQSDMGLMQVHCIRFVSGVVLLQYLSHTKNC